MNEVTFDMTGSSNFDMMSGLAALFFIVVFGIILFCIIRGVVQWNRNNNSPVLTVEVKVVSKRMDVNHHGHSNMNSGSTTTYYVTFEVESGDRMELSMSGVDYGMLADGDRGRLTFQGTRYQSFERI